MMTGLLVRSQHLTVSDPSGTIGTLMGRAALGSVVGREY